MQEKQGSGRLSVVLRLMPASEEIATMVEQFRSIYFVEGIWSFYKPEHRWRSEVGKWVLGDEWVQTWDEGEKTQGI
jgi:hypothetical protein